LEHHTSVADHGLLSASQPRLAADFQIGGAARPPVGT